MISINLFPNVLKVLPKYRPILLTKDDVSIHPGHTQYHQYLKSVDMGEIVKGIPVYSYKVNVTVEIKGGVTIILEEFENNNLTTGGSSFQINRLEGLHCPVEDFFNGTYRAECPAFPGTGCLQLVVYRLCAKFGFYRSNLDPTFTIVHEQTVCIVNNASSTDIASYRRNSPATWTAQTFDITRLTHHYGRRVSLLVPEKICAHLLNDFDNVTMMGSSHMRYSFDYILTYCFKYTDKKWLGRKHGDYKAGNIEHKPMNKAATLAWPYKESVSISQVTKKSLFMLQFGAHDLSDNPFQQTMNESIPIALRYVDALCRTGAKVLITSTAPFPDRYQNYTSRNFRNNFAISAHTYLVWKHIAQMQVSIIYKYNNILIYI